MIKISALNDESEEESGSEEDVTREALEQIALQQYSKALDLQKKGKLKDATQLLKDLLDTELLYEVNKPGPGEKAVGPLFNLKYLCLKNLASMLASADDIDAAIESYCAASELDDTDVTLWHRLGLLCMRAKRYEMALHAFQRGADRNPRHWPCLDKIVTLLLGLDYKEECISIIYETLQLDPGYLRGLAYRKHIYLDFPYIRDFMKYLNPIYEWNENEDEPIDKESAKKLIKEASDIHEEFIEQQKAEQFKYKLPDLKLKKPISEFTWKSVGDSLVHMHHNMTENFYSHACFIELVYEKLEKEAPMEVCEEEKPTEVELVEITDIEVTENIETEKDPENTEKAETELIENSTSDKDKAVTDTEKCESDLEMMPPETAEQRAENDGKMNENQPEPKKKAAVRRRGSDLSFLQQWEWCNKRRSGRKKPDQTRQDRLDDNIYDTLRRMVPPCLSPELIQKKENQARAASPDIRDLDKLYDEKLQSDSEKEENEEYFGTETEQKDVKQFINKYSETKRDIIEMLREYLNILAEKWKVKWPEGLASTFIEANNCYNNHIDIPTCTDANKDELIHYATVNILVEEFSINEKFNTASEKKESHELCVVDAIGITLYLKPHIFTGMECLELILRQLWAKMHIHILNKKEDFALDCLYQLLCEFEAMGEYQETYKLELVNFTFKPTINEAETLANIKFLERNKKLATVMDLFEKGNYNEVLSIVIDSFDHFKTMARNQEEEMSLDFAVQLSLILDTYWALDDVDNCFKWSLVCLHEALKHYFRYTSGSPEYDKWTLTVVKVLCCMEHILTTEGLTCLDSVSSKELSQGLEDLIRIIGHQVETSASDMPFGTIIPWVVMHYILQREEDKGRATIDKDKEGDEIPNPLLILFIAHEQLGNRGWCCKSDGKLLYFILDTVVPRLRSPALSKCLEQLCQCMEQCVFCLFGHPGKKNKLYKYLVDHNVTPRELNWERAQQVYEIFRPLEEPELEGKISGISADTEVLFRRILAQLPVEYDPQKYVAGIKHYIRGTEDKLPTVPPLLPFKMKDIYFLLGDYYFKKEDGKLAVKYNILDVVVNNDRLKSWAEISLAKALNLERILHSCKNLNNEREYLNPAKSIIRCFKRALELDPNHCTMWIEYGMFVYTVHSFCSRLLKQASESLSMEDFESLEKQKEDMLDTTQKCFMTVLNDLNSSHDGDKSNEDSWLHYYMLGKVAEKRNKPPSVYLDYYMKGVKSLREADATYPTKINYSTPTYLCVEVLELHYRMHASILKYIEQHENKPIPNSVGKVFTHCIEEWKNGPYMKKHKKDVATEVEVINVTRTEEPVQAANILKRSISDVGEEETHETKLLKLETAAAKVRRSASYDTERLAPKETVQTEAKEPSKILATPVKDKTDDSTAPKPDEIKASEVSIKSQEIQPVEKMDTAEKPAEEKEDKPKAETDKKDKEDSSSSASSSSSSESSSSDSSSSSSDSSRDSAVSTNSNDAKPLSDEEIMKIVEACLDALEDCASRFPAHYKAIYRVAHYHFYYKKGKDIERCRDLMLTTFAARSGQKLAGLFSERKPSNFFNNIWKIPQGEVDRAGGFAFHMSRAVLLTMEILKEIDDHKTLLDLSLQLQRIPELDKKYLRDSDREELSQQAFSLCVQSLKGQLTKFGQQPDLRKNNVEQQALKSLMLDIYRAYQRAQKQPNSKQFTNLLIEGYKLLNSDPGTEAMSHQYFVDQSMKFCQRHIQQLKYEATLASLDKSQTAQKKQVAKQPVEVPKPSTSTVIPMTKSDSKPPTSTSTVLPGLPKMSSQEMSAAFQNYLPIMNDPTQQTAALLSYLSSMNAYAGIPAFQKSLQSTLQSSYQNSFQAEFYRQFLGQTLASYLPPPPKKQKRAPKAPSSARPIPQMKPSKSFTTTTKATPASVITSLQKSTSAPLSQKSTTAPMIQKPTSTLAPSMGTVLPTLPASLTANLTSYGAPHSSHSSVHTSMPSQAHMSSASTVSAAIHTKPPLPHQQVSPGKTLQEKLAERQKHLPSSKSHEISERHKHPSKSNQEINASISKLPSSLTITKTSASKQAVPLKKADAKKSLAFSQPKPPPKPISSDEVIVLDDD